LVFLNIIKSKAIEPPNNNVVVKPEENSGTTTYPLAIPLLVVSGAAACSPRTIPLTLTSI
jgi:hypothetical protein